MLRDIRKNYQQKELLESKVNTDPLLQFAEWMNEAIAANVLEPTAMTLSTVDGKLQPHSRIVLLKDYSVDGFVFFTNYSSNKAAQISTHPQAAINFFWPELERQVRINGTIKKTSGKYSKDYFDSRPNDSKIGAWASPQSEVISSREILEKSYEKYRAKYKEQIPKPNNWGGYILKPERIEFWQGRPSRLHDRLLFTKEKEIWILKRLAP